MLPSAPPLPGLKGPRSVLLALCTVDRAGATALLRAHAFATAAGARLRVLRVLPSARGEAEAQLREVVDWCARELPYPVGPDDCAVAQGDFVAAVLAAAEPGCQLVVLPVAQWSGRAAEQLARAVRVPVLVARPARSGCVVGATNLELASFPVLSQVADLQARLEGKAVLVHSVSSASGDVGRRLDRLRGAAGELLAWAEVVVLQDPSTAHAILKVARQHDCDLIVMGAPRGEGRLFGRSVTEEVVARARRSVWVTPVEA